MSGRHPRFRPPSREACKWFGIISCILCVFCVASGINSNTISIFIVSLVFSVIGAISWISDFEDAKKPNEPEANELRIADETNKSLQDKQQSYIRQNDCKYTPEKKEVITEIAIPEGCEVGEDGLPRNKTGKGQWGDGYTFGTTVSEEGKYHTPLCQHVKYGAIWFNPAQYYGLKPLFYNNHEISWAVKHKKPCKICKPKMPNIDWYKNYLKKK